MERLEITKPKTFADYYNEEKMKPTAPMQFIQDIALLLNKHPSAIRTWISGKQLPDYANAKLIADKLGTTPEALFPNANFAKE